MKIDPRSGIGMRSTSAAGGQRTDGSAFRAHLASAGTTSQTAGAAPAGRVNILAALEAVDAQEQRRKGARRGNRLLDLLDELRLGLLSGGLQPQVLSELARTVSDARAEVDDPGLSAVLDEIDLRAQVELAKYEQGLAAA